MEEGYLLIDKPAGWTSFDVVGYVRKLLKKSSGVPNRRAIKVGHSGTLDPFATGLLIIFVGRSYTSKAATFLHMDKTYRAIMELDSSSSSGDPEGEIKSDLPLGAVAHPPKLQQIKDSLDKFIGQYDQIPPAYSAIKVNGQRAYKLAREGKPVVLAARTVNIKKIEFISYQYPQIEFETTVSGGTYIRSLVEDIARSMNRTAFTQQLRRLRIGNYSVEDALTIDELNEHTITGALTKTLEVND